MIISSLKFSTHPQSAEGAFVRIYTIARAFWMQQLSIVNSGNRHTFTVSFTFFRGMPLSRELATHTHGSRTLVVPDHVVSSSSTACSVLLNASKMTKEILVGLSSSADSRSILCLCQRQTIHDIFFVVFILRFCSLLLLLLQLHCC